MYQFQAPLFTTRQGSNRSSLPKDQNPTSNSQPGSWPVRGRARSPSAPPSARSPSVRGRARSPSAPPSVRILSVSRPSGVGRARRARRHPPMCRPSQARFMSVESPCEVRRPSVRCPYVAYKAGCGAFEHAKQRFSMVSRGLSPSAPPSAR